MNDCNMEDNLYKFLKYYNASPQWIKSVLGCSYRMFPLSIRYGKTYSKYAKLLKQSQWWSKERLEDYQWRKIEKLLKHAYKNVPYYKRVFDENGIKLKDIQNFNDFNKIPFLTKDIVRNNLKDLIAKNYPKSELLYVTTGGSSGVPLGLYYQKGVARSKEYAFITALWSSVGYKIGDRLAVLRGNVIKRADKKNFSEYEPIKNGLILSSFHMTDKNLPLYVEQIRKFKPKFLHVYPSALTILASFMTKNEIKTFSSVKAILSSSENLYAWQNKLFKKVFQCKICDLYGLAELSAFAGTFEHSNYYHIFPEYSYTEFIAKNDNPVAEENIIGEIVGTTFDNDIMPLIRYRTMDFAVPSDAKCKCGRNYRLMKKILGRKQEFFVDKTGSLVTFIYADVPLWGVKDKFNAYQYVQQEPGKVVLNIETKNKFDISDVESIKKAFCEIYFRFDIEIGLVEKIDRTERGKFQYLIQKMPIEFGNFDEDEY